MDMGGLAVAVLMLGSFAACQSGSSGERAAPATVEGVRVKLSDAEPCIWNGDSGCHSLGLRRRDPLLCVLRGASLTFDPGAAAEDVVAVAGRWSNQDFPAAGLSRRGRTHLAARRRGARRFVVSVREPLPAAARVLQLRVRYAPDVLTPYTPASEHGNREGGPVRFRHGTYVVRLRGRRSGACAKVVA